MVRYTGPGRSASSRYSCDESFDWCRITTITSASSTPSDESGSSPDPSRPGSAPSEVLNHDWLGEYAKTQYAEQVELRKSLDEKAEKIITSLGSGAGLATIAAIHAVATHKIEGWTIALLLPSFAFAMAAIALAIRVRSPSRRIRFYGLPAMAEMATFAHELNLFTAEAQRTRVTEIWTEVISKNEPLLNRKADEVTIAFRFFLVSILSLALPLIRLCWLAFQSVPTLAN